MLLRLRGRMKLNFAGSRIEALHLVSFQTFFTVDDLKGDGIAFLQSFIALSLNAGVMDKNVLPGIFDNEPVSPSVIKPLDFAARHDDSCFLGMLQMKTDTTGNRVARQLILETSHANCLPK
jgi:hypothetical protein